MRFSWPVYGESKTAGALLSGIGGEGCVTMPYPQPHIMCTMSCDEIKKTDSGGRPGLNILSHEACHACAFEEGGHDAWKATIWPDPCDNNPNPAKPMW